MAHSVDQETSAPLSSTSTLTYDVFVGFRGPDTRTSFTDLLLAALDREGIRTYRDNKNLPRGENIRTELMKAIEPSKIAVIVFSQNYASSDWCLEELVKIIECQRRLHLKVLPIFYDVSPSEVRELAEAPANGNEYLVERWRAALTVAAILQTWQAST